MRRFMILFVLVLFLLIGAGRGDSADLQMYVSSNTTACRADTAVSTSTIIPGKHWILGFRVTANNGSCVDPTVILYDATSAGSGQFDSLEADTSPLKSDGDWYPFGGKKLASGLSIRQGGYTDVTVFYERRIQ